MKNKTFFRRGLNQQKTDFLSVLCKGFFREKQNHMDFNPPKFMWKSLESKRPSWKRLFLLQNFHKLILIFKLKIKEGTTVSRLIQNYEPNKKITCGVHPWWLLNPWCAKIYFYLLYKEFISSVSSRGKFVLYSSICYQLDSFAGICPTVATVHRFIWPRWKSAKVLDSRETETQKFEVTRDARSTSQEA